MVCTRPSPHLGRTSDAPTHQLLQPTGISDAGTGTGFLLRHSAPRRAIVGAWRIVGAWPRSAAALARGAAATRGYDASTGRSGAAPTATAPTRCCCASRTREIAARRGADRARAGSSATARGRPGLERARAARGLLAASADDGHRAAAPGFAGAGAAIAGTHARGRSRSPASSRRRSACARSQVADEDRAAVPRRGVDRLELPGHARGGRRAARRRGRASSAICSCRWSGRRSRTGPRWAPSGRSPARSRAATRPPSPASARRSPSGRPSCSQLFDALVEATALALGRPRSPGGPAGMRTLRTVAELRAALRRPRRAGRSIGLVPTMGALPRRPPVADPPRARGVRRRRRVAVRQPDPVQRPARPRRLPARRGSATPSSPPRPASTTCSPRPPRRSTRPGFATTVSVGRADRDARGRAPRAAAISTASRPSSPSSSTSSRPDVAYFGQKDAQQALVIKRLVARPRHPGRGSRSARRSASPTGSRCRAATCTCRPPTARARPRSTAR